MNHTGNHSGTRTGQIAGACPAHGTNGRTDGRRPSGIPPRLKKMRKAGLYDPAFERAACGVGIVANIDGTRSHRLIDQALEVLINLGHREACGCDPDTGDGAGFLFQTPHTFFKRVTHEAGIELPDAGRYGVGMIFLPQDAPLRERMEAEVEAGLADEGLVILGWRDVPTDPSAIGTLAREVMPVIKQVFVAEPGGSSNGIDPDAYRHADSHADGDAQTPLLA